MDPTRRDFLQAGSLLAAAMTVAPQRLFAAASAAAAPAMPPVVWLQAQSCSGCSVSLLNSVHYMTADVLLTKTVSMKYHSTLMGAAGTPAKQAAETALAAGSYVLVVEGAIPTGTAVNTCLLWPGMTALRGVQTFAAKASFIIAAGTCGSYGGVVAGTPNPTTARALDHCVSGKRVINIPGCPVHPDWLVGTIAYLLQNGRAPELDSLRRPKMYFATTVHEQCPYRDDDDRCLEDKGCRGKKAKGDCPRRQWNAAVSKGYGVNWCVIAGSPCQGCTEPGFPDSMSPFYREDEDDDEHEDGEDREEERKRYERALADAPAPRAHAEQQASLPPNQTVAEAPSTGANPPSTPLLGEKPYERVRRERREAYQRLLEQRRKAHAQSKR